MPHIRADFEMKPCREVINRLLLPRPSLDLSMKGHTTKRMN